MADLSCMRDQEGDGASATAVVALRRKDVLGCRGGLEARVGCDTFLLSGS